MEDQGFIDSHCHLSFLHLDVVQDFVMKGIQQGMEKWILGGYDSGDWERQIILKENLPHCFKISFGIHPWRLDELSPAQLEREFRDFEEKFAKADFVGETGLDFFRATQDEEKEIQKEVFVKHLRLAQGKPVILHIVQAHGPALEILGQHKPSGGLVHRFTGSIEVAKQYMDMGLFLSIGPDILRDSPKLAKTVKEIPLENLLVESDSPSNFNDETDPVEKFFQVAEAVAKIKGLEVSSLLEKTSANVRTLIKDDQLIFDQEDEI